MLTTNSILKNLIRNTKKKNPLQIICSGFKKIVTATACLPQAGIQTCNSSSRGKLYLPCLFTYLCCDTLFRILV